MAIARTSPTTVKVDLRCSAADRSGACSNRQMARMQADIHRKPGPMLADRLRGNARIADDLAAICTEPPLFPAGILNRTCHGWVSFLHVALEKLAQPAGIRL